LGITSGCGGSINEATKGFGELKIHATDVFVIELRARLEGTLYEMQKHYPNSPCIRSTIELLARTPDFKNAFVNGPQSMRWESDTIHYQESLEIQLFINTAHMSLSNLFERWRKNPNLYQVGYERVRSALDPLIMRLGPIMI